MATDGRCCRPAPSRRSRSTASRSRLRVRAGRRCARSSPGRCVALLVVIGSIAGGAYLWFHESVAEVVATTPDVKIAAKRLDVALPGQPATALVVGYDQRAGEGPGTRSRSDTVMLVRADPETKSISLLSFPRDLYVQVVCPGGSTFNARINAAYSECGTKGTLETVRKLTGLPINYLITVNFRGFRQLVDAVGGVWMDVDRRYFNDRGGDFGYATINLFPGYQKLGGYQALDFVRYRHTDSDLYRVARQQLFVRAFKDQVKSSTSAFDLPKVVSTITKNVEVGAGRHQGARPEDRDPVRALRLRAAAWALLPGEARGSRGERLLRPARTRAERQERRAGVRQPGRRVTGEGDGGRAEREAEAGRRHGAAGARDHGERAERKRRGGLGRHRELSPLAAWLPDGLRARRQERERAELGVLQDADPLRQGAAGRGGGGEEGRGPVRHGRCGAARSGDQSALERCAADRDRRPDLPRHAHGGARRQDAAAPAGERRAGRGSVPGTAPGAGEARCRSS